MPALRLKIGSPRLDFLDWELTRRLRPEWERVWLEELKPLALEQGWRVLWRVQEPAQRELP